MAWNLLEDLTGLHVRVEPPSWRHETDIRSFYIDALYRRQASPQMLQPGTSPMTVTSLGILLIVNGVLLWAIMAALHRHTVVLKGLQSQMEALSTKRRPNTIEDIAADGDLSAGRHWGTEKLSPIMHRTERVDSSTK
ncbi:MAG TPA: hypothetical protein VN731_04515 [Rhodanobacter sp.]|nr:hypothetical protein [Rhodanobacter sp.]